MTLPDTNDAGASGTNGGDSSPTGTTASDTDAPETTASDTGAPETTASDTGAPETTMTSGGTGEDTGPVSEMCMLAPGEPDHYIVWKSAAEWDTPVDEPCTVLVSDQTDAVLELELDCPIHAAAHGGETVRLVVQSGPMPAPLQVGDVLDVFYRKQVVENYEWGAKREFLFLRRDDALLYAAVYGREEGEPEQVPELLAPLGVVTEQGACPFVATGQEPLDGSVCWFEAEAQTRFTAGDQSLVLTAGMSGEIAAGERTYAVDVRRARLGHECADQVINVDDIAHAIALLPAP